jgi:hypothetical protein
MAESLMPNPNTFAAHMLAGMEASGFRGDHLGQLKNRWHDFRLFVEYVASGQDKKDYEAMLAREKAVRDKAEAVKAADEAAEKARREQNEREFGARRAAIITS